MSPGRPLVTVLKTVIERTYGLPPLIHDLAPFIVGDEGYRRYYGEAVPESRGPRACILVRESGGSVRAALYCPDSLVRHLEKFNPLNGLGDVNIEEFAVLVEEIDHLVTLASRASEGRPVTLLELEHHANITKYLAVLHFLGRQMGRRRLPEPMRQWARFHLFERYSEARDAEGARYREAARLAWRYLRFLDGLRPGDRRTEIQTFHRRSVPEILRLVHLN